MVVQIEIVYLDDFSDNITEEYLIRDFDICFDMSYLYLTDLVLEYYIFRIYIKIALILFIQYVVILKVKD